jgi:hypothetical protein
VPGRPATPPAAAQPDRLDPEIRDRAELAVGDQRDAGYVAEATRGAEAV